MKFYGRTSEIEALRKVREISYEFARFTVLTGRRRVGKTQLVRHVFDDGASPYVHLVITRKVEKVQTAIHQSECDRVLGWSIHGTCTRFAELFEELMKESINRPFTLVLDEIQEFDRVDDSIFGEVAGVWDKYHDRSKINLVICGSVNRLMNKIFFDDSQPLYGRNTGKLELRPFTVSVLKEILSDFKPGYTEDDLLSLWTITGGVARYVELLMEYGACDRTAMVETFFGVVSSFLNEAKTILSEEFGKDYGAYFTILAAIASGHTSYSEICNLIGSDIGGYLTRLERQYNLIVKTQPIYEKTGNKNMHYQIDDCFFRFWFRFVYGYQGMIELNRIRELREIVLRDFETFSGYALERYFRWKFIEDTGYTAIGAWWDRRGENEIDLVCEDADGSLDFYEIKREADRISLSKLEAKTLRFFEKNPQLQNRRRKLAGLSMKDM